MGVIEELEKKAVRGALPSPGDYEQDGLLYCGKCHEPKQCIVIIGGIEKKMPCTCKCAQKEPDKRDRIEQLQRQGGVSPNYTFARAQPSKAMNACRRYADKWDKMAKKNFGLVLWGGVGTGKTYAAHAIANELILRDIPVFVTSLSRVLNSGFDKSEALRRIREAPLVVFDDLGAERSSEYALETVFMMVDERYRAHKPLIVTTNLTHDELKNPRDVDRKRIYDRILGRCVPVQFDGGSKREEEAAEMLRVARELLGAD